MGGARLEGGPAANPRLIRSLISVAVLIRGWFILGGGGTRDTPTPPRGFAHSLFSQRPRRHRPPPPPPRRLSGHGVKTKGVGGTFVTVTCGGVRGGGGHSVTPPPPSVLVVSPPRRSVEAETPQNESGSDETEENPYGGGEKKGVGDIGGGWGHSGGGWGHCGGAVSDNLRVPPPLLAAGGLPGPHREAEGVRR